jgi:hypothetical protein
MKYLKLFEEKTGYDSFVGGEDYIEPHVALIRGEDSVVYKPYIPPPPITFYIENWEMTAIEGMTFEEWVNSEYNIHPNIGEKYWVIVDSYFKDINGQSFSYDGTSENLVKGNDIIIENRRIFVPQGQF